MTDPAIVRAALTAYGLDGASIEVLQDFVNASFRVAVGDQAYSLRVYAQDRRERPEVESEMRWLAAVAADSVIPCPWPLRLADGHYAWEAPGACFVTVASLVEGGLIPNAERTPEHFGLVGAMLAKLHLFSGRWQTPAGFTRPRCDADGIFAGDHQELDAKLRCDLARAKQELRQAEDAIGRDAAAYGLVHGDPSFSNILFDGDRPALIDFDDCGFGHYAFDLAVVLAGAWGKPRYAVNRAALLDGYQEIRRLSGAELAAFPALMAARAASLIFWAAAQSPPEHDWISAQWERLREYLEGAAPTPLNSPQEAARLGRRGR